MLGRDQGVVHLETNDPVWGKRERYLPESETKKIGDDPLLMQPSGSSNSNQGKTNLSTIDLNRTLALLPHESANILSNVIVTLQKAVGQKIDVRGLVSPSNIRAGAGKNSGKLFLSVTSLVGDMRNWKSLPVNKQVRIMQDWFSTIGHEITHIAQTYGERSDLKINGKPLLQAIRESVFGLSLDQRTNLVKQIDKLAGNPKRYSAYLSGDIEAIRKVYEPSKGKMSDEEVMNRAAGEFLAEVGSIELAKRAQLNGLPDVLRNIIDKFKQIIVNTISWIRGEGKNYAPLQNLSDIANKMFDHMSSADRASLDMAFKDNKIYRTSDPSPSLSEPVLASHNAPASEEPIGPISVTYTPEFVRAQMVSLTARTVLGGAVGGVAAPNVSDHQISAAEGILIGGVLGAFGPAAAKMLLNKNLTAEVIAIAKRTGGNPFNIFKAIMNGKSWAELGQLGMNVDGTASATSKIVRFLEMELNMNMPKEIKSMIENAKGAAQTVIATLQDSFNKTRFYNPNAALSELTQRLYDGRLSREAFNKALTTPEEIAYGKWATTAVDARKILSSMFAEGLPKGGFKNIILAGIDNYLVRSYSAFKEGKFNEGAYQAAKADMMERFPEYTSEIADMRMREHQREILANKDLFSGSKISGQKLESATLKTRLSTEGEIEAQREVVSAFEHDQKSTEYKEAAAKLDWMEKHAITDNWREWLGEYKNPNDRMIHTVQKLYASSISSRLFDAFDNHVTKDGMRFAYKGEELGVKMNALKEEIAKGGPDIVTLQKQLEELKSYTQLEAGSKFGKLSGKFVNRFVRDEMATYDGSFKWMDQPIMRSIARVNSIIKINRTVLNPLTMIRNYLQIPIFALMAKAKFSDLGKAWGILKGGGGLEGNALLTEMRKRHIVGADFVASELGHGPGSFFSGNFDADVATKAAGGAFDWISKMYQQPDILVRAGAFMSARERFAGKMAKELGLSVKEAMNHSAVLDKAAEFTERYTMNYSAVPRIIKAARQLPFISLFVSYTSEITRILKNLVQDSINPGIDSAGRMHAITTLGAMAAIPTMIMAGAKGNLSEKDREDWDQLEKLSPDYNRARFRVPTGRNPDGTFSYFDMTNLIPADSFTTMIRAFVNGDAKAMIASNPIASLQDTPLLNIASEQITGRDRNTGQTIENMGRLREVMKEVLPPIIPPGYEGQRLERAFTENNLGELGTTNLKTGVTATPGDILLNYLTGMRFSNVSLSAVQRGAVADAKAELQVQRSVANKVLMSNSNEVDRQYAAEHLRKVSEEILKELTTKLQPAK